MKKIIAAVTLSLFYSTIAFAHHPQVPVVLKAKNGNVTFSHQKHLGMKGLACTDCHDTDKGGKIAQLGKEWGHKTCMGCHKKEGKGPTKCTECHKK